MGDHKRKEKCDDLACSIENLQIKLNKKQDALVVVGIDFGTTYSGYGYSFRNEYRKDHSKIYSNTDWQSGDGLVTPKTPTAILFDEEGVFESFGYDAEQTYAELLDSGDTDGYYFFSRFKMKLFQNEVPDEFLHPLVKKKNRISRDLVLEDDMGKPMKALKVFSECIKFLKDHFLKKIKHLKLERNDIHWVLTVPAIWRDNAKQFMRETAKEAGIEPDLLTLAYEPEAAAIYCKELTVQKKDCAEGSSLESFEPGQQFMVLDCGGGTIDVTSYQIQNASQLKELDKPSGGPWGGTYVDVEYMSFLEKLVGKEVWNKFKLNSPEDVLDIKRKFEAKKRGFKESSKIKTTIPYPPALFRTYSELREGETIKNDLKKSVYANSITVTNEKMRFEHDLIKHFFQKSIDSIIIHVKGLLDENQRRGGHISTILMVGGFSDSTILYERVKKELHWINVICPPDAVTTVLKGAVMYGHNPDLINERICPRTYGIDISVPFNDKIHPDRLKCLIEGREMCSDIFKVIVGTGEQLIIGKSTFDVTCNPSQSYDTEATVELYESNKKEPMYTIDKDVHRLGILTVPIPDFSRGKSRKIRISLHFGYTELFVSATEEGTDRKTEAVFNCLLK